MCMLVFLAKEVCEWYTKYMNVIDPNNPTVPVTDQSAEVVEATPTQLEMNYARTDVPPSATEALDEKSWAMAAHLGGLAGYMIPFGNIIAPVVIWQMKKDQSGFITEHAKEAVNFQITMMIAAAISALLMLVVIGIFLMFAVVIVDIIFIIMASIAANKGEQYRYPLSIRFIK